MKVELQGPYPSVVRPQGRSYGGNQGWDKSRVMRECGCGVIACTDLLWYLSRRWRVRGGESLPAAGTVTERAYRQSVADMGRYLPLIPRHGVNGLFLAWGLNRRLRRSGLPLRCRWRVSGKKLWPRMEDMLRRDLPVIFAVGPNLPKFWGKARLPFYRKTAEGDYVEAARTRGHYVTVTGMDETWLRVASWGRMYYIRRDEYEDYVRRHSNYVVSNLLELRER